MTRAAATMAPIFHGQRLMLRSALNQDGLPEAGQRASLPAGAASEAFGGVGSNPLAPLLEFLPQARDVGLHLIVAWRTGGASRALYEPVLMRLREISTPGIVMSGNRDEGVLLGNVRPGPLPPGRGWLVTRREGTRLVQLVNLPSRT